MPVSIQNDKEECGCTIDTTAPKEPTEVEHLGTPGSYDGYGAADKRSDSDSQPPVDPPAEGEPDDAFRDPVKEGV